MGSILDIATQQGNHTRSFDALEQTIRYPNAAAFSITYVWDTVRSVK